MSVRAREPATAALDDAVKEGRTTAKNMETAGRLSGLLIQALRELGKEHVTPERREHLKRTLPADKRRELIKDLRLAPAWMHPIFRELAGEGA